MDHGKIRGKRHEQDHSLCKSVTGSHHISNQIGVLYSNIIRAYLYIETECLLKGKREETLKREGVPNIGSNNQSKETIFKNILIVTLVVHA